MLPNKQTKWKITILLMAVALAIAAHAELAARQDRENSENIAVAGELGRNADQALAASPEVVPGEVLVAFGPGVGRNRAEAIHRSMGATEIKVFSQIGVRHWRLPPGLGVAQAIQVLSRNPNVRFAEANYILHIDNIPNDPRTGDLWGLHNIGQTGGTPDADIDAPEAWGIQTGSPDIVVGVIDTGIDYLHEDLADNIWINLGESGLDGQGNPKETNGIDDDGNGFIDDVMGWDFVNEDNDPMDDNGHGSHTAGTIGAVGNNGIGVTGANWTVQLMPVKCFDSGGRGATDDIIEAILYAASFEDGSNKIVRITNNSWGGGRRSKAMQDAIASSGALFVASAGNSASSKKQYPAGYDLDNIISVAATDHNDELASFSNFGSGWVDLAAPGVNILSSTIPNNDYSYKSGTLMAAPHVAGVAALIMAKFPGWNNDEIKTQIIASVDALPSLEGKVVSGGCLNARSALNGSEGPPDITAPAAVLDLAVTATTFDTVNLTWTATGDDGDIGTAYLYDVRYSTSAIITDADFDSATSVQGEPLPQGSGSPETFTVTGLSGETTYHLALKVADEAGNLSVLSNVVIETTFPTPPGLWQIETVASEGNVGFYNDLAY
ncbi:MAG: S8 family serine peptidase, partial [Phycisphaerae bacterium]|nr:S8 family serine peptidase [Phycisphaerae bacterium]